METSKGQSGMWSLVYVIDCLAQSISLSCKRFTCLPNVFRLSEHKLFQAGCRYLSCGH